MERDRSEAGEAGEDEIEEDEIEEPPNSTLNDWRGQRMAEDLELADEVLEETGGDEQEAERRFEERSAGNDPKRDINRPKPS